MHHMDIPIDYHEWSVMLEHYQTHAKAGQYHRAKKLFSWRYRMICCIYWTISVFSIKFASYVAWILIYKVWSLAQIHITTTEIQHFFLGNCFPLAQIEHWCKMINVLDCQNMQLTLHYLYILKNVSKHWRMSLNTGNY